MSKTSKILYFILTIVFFIFFDMYFTSLIIQTLKNKTISNTLYELVLTQNTGAAFNILEDYKIFLILFAIVAIFIISSYVFRHLEKFSTISVFWAAMLLSGIGCNMYERMAFGYVRDFFKLNFIDFPVFNVADICITIGVFMLMAKLLIFPEGAN